MRDLDSRRKSLFTTLDNGSPCNALLAVIAPFWRISNLLSGEYHPMCGVQYKLGISSAPIVFFPLTNGSFQCTSNAAAANFPDRSISARAI